MHFRALFTLFIRKYFETSYQHGTSTNKGIYNANNQQQHNNQKINGNIYSYILQSKELENGMPLQVLRIQVLKHPTDYDKYNGLKWCNISLFEISVLGSEYIYIYI